MAISRLYNHASGDVIEANEINEEYNQLISEVNSKPNADGTLQSSLNADKVDGLDADTAGTGAGLSVNNGNLMVGLNADKLDGYDVDDLIAGAFPSGTRILLYRTPTWLTSNMEGWSDITPSTTTGQEMVIMAGAPGGNSSANFPSQFGSTAPGATGVGDTWLNSFTATITPFTLTTDQLPPHSHSMQHFYRGVTSGTAYCTAVGGDLSVPVPEETGSVGSGQTISPTGYAEFGDWRPPHARVIIIEKD